MARQARGEVINPAIVQIVHCTQRCVRRAFLCGTDAYSGKSYEHRREWIRWRLEFLASAFGIDCLTYTVMHNHIHLVLRSRPDVVKFWSDKEVARRWLMLFPCRREKDGSPCEPTEAEINHLSGQAKKLRERRRRLSDISWWMRCTSEHIARRSNSEDEVTGHFWEGRFRSQLILDEAGLLACAAYVDLNPVRAAIADSPERSRFTGVKDRLDDLQACEGFSATLDYLRRGDGCGSRSGWLAPIQIDEANDPTGPVVSAGRRRASDKGFLSISLEAYLQLLDWTGREIRDGKRGQVPADLRPILQRIGLEGASWCELITRFRRCFKRAAGSSRKLADEATRRGCSWLQAPGNPLKTV